MPLHDLDVWILCRRMNIEARCDRSPRNRKMFMVSEWRSILVVPQRAVQGGALIELVCPIRNEPTVLVEVQ